MTDRFKQLSPFYSAVILIALILSCLAASVFVVSAQTGDKDEIESLNQQVKDKKELADTINSQIKAYQDKIKEKQSQISSLQEQMGLIENRIAKAQLDIQAVKLELESINLEIVLIENQIIEKENEIQLQKDIIAKLLRRINKLDQRSYLEVLLANNSFSEFFDQIKYLEGIQGDLQGMLDQVQTLKTDLEDKKSRRESKKNQLEETKHKLEQEQADLVEETNLKDILLQDTKSSETMYQQLMADLREEQQYINSQVMYLEDNIRKKIEAMDKAFESRGDMMLSWPLDPSRGITAYFHDPTYPFRHLFEHSGIDLRAYQGTPVKAAAPGYVVWAKQGQLYGNFVMILHAGGVSTVYAHLSKINAKIDQFVERGEVIGLSGGMPGTPGAGLSTGPHLHFETRQNGIPVNPLNFLINY